MKERPVIGCMLRAEWAAWLEAHHATSGGVWLKLARKASGIPSLTAAEALEVALCYGWIDGQAAPLDEVTWLQSYTPRRAKSKWSQKNRAAALRLIETGEMRPAGLAAVQAAQADGRWDAAYPSARDMPVPEDLQRLLDASPAAARAFAALRKLERYSILYRLADAKRPETRQRRLEKFFGMLERGEPIR